MICPDCKAPLIGVQYQGTPEDWDGVSEWSCACGFRVGRWSGKRLAEGELEPRYGIARTATSRSEYRRLKAQGVPVNPPVETEPPKGGES